MYPRERILRTLNHKEADRIPKDLGSTIVTTITRNAYYNLLNYLNLKEDIEIEDYFQGVVIPSEKVLKSFDIDFRRVGLPNKPEIKDFKYTDSCGIIYRKAFPHDYYDIVYNPLKNMEIEEIEKYPWPEFEYTDQLKNLSDKAKDLYENSKYGVVGDIGLCGFNEFGQKLRGWENFSMDLMTNPNLIKRLFDIMLKVQKNYWEHYLKAIGKYIHVICWADDLGTQDRPQIPPVIFKKLIKPYYKEMFDFIKSRTDAKLFIHSCGDIYPFIGDLIEVGVDILNPVQVTAREMDPKRLKDEFRDKLVFWGAIDEQFVLNSNSSAEIMKNIKNIMGILGEGSGYILAAGHNIQEDAPPENILALFDSV